MTDIEKEEVVVGVHASGVELEEGLNTSTKKNYCTNCQRNTHSYVKVDKDTHEAVIHKTCKNDDCECKCRTHFVCKRCGYLHPYGQKCNEKYTEMYRTAKNDKEFEKLMKDWRKSR